MKKWLILLFSLFFFTACSSSKALSEKEAASVFIDAIIYNKQTQLFKENFADATEALKVMHGKDEEAFTQELIQGIMQTSNISKDEAATISSSMEQVLKEQTKYQVKAVKEKKNHAYEVTYEIYGVDFIQGFKTAMTNMFEQMLKNPAMAQDTNNLEKELAIELSQGLKDAGIVKKPVEVKVELTKEKDKWRIANSQLKNLQNLTLAFWLGKKDQQDFIKETMQVTTDLSNEFQEKMLQGQ